MDVGGILIFCHKNNFRERILASLTRQLAHHSCTLPLRHFADFPALALTTQIRGLDIPPRVPLALVRFSSIITCRRVGVACA